MSSYEALAGFYDRLTEDVAYEKRAAFGLKKRTRRADIRHVSLIVPAREDRGFARLPAAFFLPHPSPTIFRRKTP